MKYEIKGSTDSNIIKLICENREVDYYKLEEFLNPTKDSIIGALVYENIERAARRIIFSVLNNEKIGIVVDADLDGNFSAAMIINYLREVFDYENVEYFIHSNKAHGLTQEIMDAIDGSDINLLIIPDAGTNDIKQHKLLKDKEIDVVVIDHHEVEKISEDAIVVNNQIGNFGNKTLCGAGMVLKVLNVIDAIIDRNEADNYLDLVAVALVGDSMDMNVPETRYLVQKGLLNINNPLLFEISNPNKEKNFEMISYDIAPAINSFIRVGSREEKEDLFKALICEDEKRSLEIRGQGEIELNLAEYIARLSPRIKNRQATEVKKALEHRETLVLNDDLPITICILSEDANRNLTGLIGNKLVDEYNKPVIVLKKLDNGNFGGSGRSTTTFTLFKDYIETSGYFKFAQGHQSAFGCRIAQEKLIEFIEKIKGKTLGSENTSYKVDKAYIDNVSAFDILEVDKLKNHWGKGFEKPKFYIELNNISNSDIDVIGPKKDTIRIKKDNITYIKFKCTPEEIKNIINFKMGTIKIIGSFNINEWNDRLFPQVIIDVIKVEENNIINVFDFKL